MISNLVILAIGIAIGSVVTYFRVMIKADILAEIKKLIADGISEIKKL